MIEEIPQHCQMTQSALDVPCAASSHRSIGSGLILQHKLAEQKTDQYDAQQIDSGYLDPSDVEETEEEEDELSGKSERNLAARQRIISEIENEHIQRVFVPRETEHKLKRRRNLLVTKLHHLRKDLNILVIGPDNAGKYSLFQWNVHQRLPRGRCHAAMFIDNNFFLKAKHRSSTRWAT